MAFQLPPAQSLVFKVISSPRPPWFYISYEL